MRGPALVVVVGIVVAGFAPLRRLAHAESFTDVFGRSTITAPVGEAMARSVSRSLPVIAASPGVTFTFDPATHTFERSTDILGQVLLERAAPLGRGKWNLAIAYQWMRIDTVDGRDARDLDDPGPPIVVGRAPSGGPVLASVDRFSMRLDTDAVTMSATYGVTDRLDLNLTLPLLASDLKVRSFQLKQAPSFSGEFGSIPSQPATDDESHAGPGDLLLRAKHRLLRGQAGELSAGLVVRMPSGDRDYFQGTGTWGLAPLLYASTRPRRVGGPVELRGHLNAGVDFDVEEEDRSEGRFGVGLDAAIGARGSVGLTFLAREPFAGIAQPGFYDVVRQDPASGRRSAGPFLGLDRSRDSYYDLAVGGRVALWRETLIGFANVVVPLNDDGFRSDVIPLVGVELAF